MGINKVVINRPSGEETLIDLTMDSVVPEKLLKGFTAHNSKGEPIIGLYEAVSGEGIADISTKEVTPNSNALSVEFTGLTGEPSAFAIQPVENITLSSTRSVVSVTYDGTETEGVCGYSSGSFMSSSATNAYSASNFTWEYENGTLTVTSNSASTSGYFKSGTTYKLFYVTGGASGGTSDSGSATEPNLQSKSVTPSETEQTIKPDTGYDGLSQVSVGAISKTYVGSGVTKLGEKTYTPSTSQQTIEAGQYLEGEQTILPVTTETKTITENGTYTPDEGKFFSSITVEVPTNSGDDSEIVEVQGTLPAGLMYGDVNMDGYITEEDSELLETHVLQGGGVITDATALELADLNGDGNVSSKDYKQLKRIALQGEQTTGYMGDYLGNWSVSDYWGTDFSKRFYVDINVGEATENKLAVITADVDIAENDFKALCGNGTIRIYAKNLPLNSLAVTINMKEKSTNIFLQEKVIAPTEVEQIITPDEGYEGFSQVKISAIPSGDDAGSGDGLPDVIVAGDTPILGSWVGSQVTATKATDTGLSVTIPQDETYRFYIPATKGTAYGSTTNPTIQIYKNGVAAGDAIAITTATPTKPYSIDLECSAGDVIKVYATAVKSSYSTTAVTVMALIACIDA